MLLARSLKLGGRCLAGISTLSGRWVRPISGHATGELYPHQCSVDGGVPALLDVVRFEHEGNVGDPAQPENVRIAQKPWARTGRLVPSEAYAFLRQRLADGPSLLENRGKAVPEHVAAEGVEASLALIEPSEIEWCLTEKRDGHAQARAQFRLSSESYDLAVTDVDVRPRLLGQEYFGRYTGDELRLPASEHILFATSLGEAYGGWHTKLVAAVLFLP